jgi:hypothetical protein
MAKTKQPTDTPEPKRQKRRSPEQIIADLQRKIEQIQARATARSVERSPAMKLSRSVVRTVDKALAAAAAEGNDGLRQALTDARAPLASYLAAQGMRLPKPRMPRRRPAAGA